MEVLSNSVSVLSENWQLILGILLIILSGQILAASAIRAIFRNRLTEGDYLSIGLAGWVLPVSIYSSLWFLWGLIRTHESTSFLTLVPLLLFALILFFQFRRSSVPDSKAIFWMLSLLLLASVFLRLAFVFKAIIPLYFDSAEHYSIIKNLLGSLNSSNSFRWPTSLYYHWGFHLLTAFTVSVTHAQILKVMLILGQMILAVTPLSIFFLIKHETKSTNAGLFAILLTGFGWYMPAYAVNWGKYPALTSLAPLQFVLSAAYLSHQNKGTLSSRQQWFLNAILAAGIIITGLMHSRSLVVFAIVVLAWVTAVKWQNLSMWPRTFILSLVVIGIVSEFIYIQPQDILERLFDPYVYKGYLVTSLAVLLSIFALRVYPRLTFSSILAVFLLLGSLFIPVTKIIPMYGNLTLLDRPFVELILYLPLSLLGGLGLAGLEKTLQNSQTRFGTFHVSWSRYVGFLAIGLVLVNALINYTVYPSDCCNIVSRDDLLAIDWMDKNLPMDARILISSTELSVLPSGVSQGPAGADAGIWIAPLINRKTVTQPFNTNFSQQGILNALCKMQINYIYVGAVGNAFNDSEIKAQPPWYKAVLSMPKVKVYQVVGCL